MPQPSRQVFYCPKYDTHMKFGTSVEQLCDSLFQKQSKHLSKEALELQIEGQILLCQNFAKSNLEVATQLVKIVQEEPLAMVAL